MILERRFRVRDALYVGVSDSLFGNLYAILHNALIPTIRDMEEPKEFIRYFMQSLRNYCYPPFQDAEHEKHAQHILHTRSIDELLQCGQRSVPENLQDVQLRQRGVEPLTDEQLQSPGMQLLYRYKNGEIPNIFDTTAIHSSIADFATVYPQRFIQGDFRQLDALPHFQADARIHIRALIDLIDDEYADYLLYSVDHLHPGGIIQDDAPKTRGSHKPRLDRFLEKLATHPIPANVVFVTRKISGALESVLVQRKCQYVDHDVPYPYMTIEDLQNMGVAHPTHDIVTPEYYDLHGGIAHSEAKQCLADSIGIENLEEIHVDTLEISVGQQFSHSTLRRLEQEAQQPLTAKEAQEVIGTFLGKTNYEALR